MLCVARTFLPRVLLKAMSRLACIDVAKQREKLQRYGRQRYNGAQKDHLCQGHFPRCAVGFLANEGNLW